MSLQIIKPGLLDTVQDAGRYGYQHLGINPSGAMDRISAQEANALLGKNLNDPVIEMHFPAAEIRFIQSTVICITGADFCPAINKRKIPMDQPVIVPADAVLQFQKRISGARCYLSVTHPLVINKWLGSFSTNIVAAAGGYHGRSLKKDDIILFNEMNFAATDKLRVLPWRSTISVSIKKEVRCVKGNEWTSLDDKSMELFYKEKFRISSNSNRMGYRLAGPPLASVDDYQLVSSAVSFGTVQLLPDGQLIVLMADHQTTGGYPRIAQVITADLPLLAQCNPGDEICFVQTESKTAQKALLQQHRDLINMQTAATFKMEKL